VPVALVCAAEFLKEEEEEKTKRSKKEGVILI
jgi:hypothetical protein